MKNLQKNTNVAHSKWYSKWTTNTRSFQEFRNHIKFAYCEFGYQFICGAFWVSWCFWVNHLSRVTSPLWLHLWDHTCSTTTLQKLPQLQINWGEDSGSSSTENICILYVVTFRHDIQTADTNKHKRSWNVAFYSDVTGIQNNRNEFYL